MTGPELLEALVAAGLSGAAASRARASSWSNGPGDRYSVHAHEYDKVLVATAGSITFELPDQRRAQTMLVGERLELPAGTPHAAVVGPEGVACLELHLPPGALEALRPGSETDGSGRT